MKKSSMANYESRTYSFKFIRQRLKFGTIVNWVLLSLHGGSFKMKRAVLQNQSSFHLRLKYLKYIYFDNLCRHFNFREHPVTHI